MGRMRFGTVVSAVRVTLRRWLVGAVLAAWRWGRRVMASPCRSLVRVVGRVVRLGNGGMKEVAMSEMVRFQYGAYMHVERLGARRVGMWDRGIVER